MTPEQFEEELLQERRARLAAERLLELKKAELGAANRQLSDHALALSGQIMDQRRVVDTLQGENTSVKSDLEVANTKVVAMERLLWAALETIPDGFAMFGPDFRLIAANGPYLQAFDDSDGIQPGVSYQTIVDACLDDGLVDLQGQEEDEWYDLMLDRWDAPTIQPITLRFWNGMYVKMVDRRTSDGGVVSLALNITESIEREQELVKARDKAQAADRAKSAFLAKMSHELRTPMNGVVGMADLLAERGLDEEAMLYTETIRNSSQALLDIINDILDFSKLGAEKLTLSADPFDLEALVQDVCMIIGPGLREKPVELLLDYDQSLPTTFVGDAGRLRQILVNLVGNAAKFTEDGKILIRVVGGPEPSTGTCALHFTIEDSGIGIPADMVDHIFGEFNQIEDEKNRKYEGTGLGLAITRKLVDAMDGEIWVDSEAEEGSAFGFQISLPCPGEAHRPGGLLPDGLSHAIVWSEGTLDKSLLDRQLGLLGLERWFVSNAAELDLAIDRRRPDIVLCAPKRLEAVHRLLSNRDNPIPLVSFATTLGETADIPRPFTRKHLYEALAQAFSNTATRNSPGLLKVLAAEDNKTNQLVLTKMLNGLDIDLHLVSDGQQAIDAYLDSRPDLILMDISMPKKDGMEAAREIRALEGDGPHVPIIAMTAHALHEDRDRILASGIDHYLTKPLNRTELTRYLSDATRELKKAS
jgi:signal transduction histidine kinase/CheY-like chemotaxis protein